MSSKQAVSLLKKTYTQWSDRQALIADNHNSARDN